jgi:hypothetical protein
LQFIYYYTISESVKIKMFSKLRCGLKPHGSVSSKCESDNVRYEASRLSSAIAQQLKVNCDSRLQTVETEKILGLNTMNKAKLTGLAETILTEVLYYNQLDEIGCFLASAYSNDENQNGQLSANMLIACGRNREKLIQLTERLDISYALLGPASYTQPSEQSRSMYGTLLSLIHTKLGGNSYDANNDEPSVTLRREVLSLLCEISEHAWTVMNLCGMLNAFKYSPNVGTSPLFDTVQVIPSESVFGNNGWKSSLKAAVMRIPEPEPELAQEIQEPEPKAAQKEEEEEEQEPSYD